MCGRVNAQAGGLNGMRSAGGEKRGGRCGAEVQRFEVLRRAKTGGGVKWSHAFALKVRKGGEKGFVNAAKYGIEVFEDKNTGALIYICENGSIGVVKK